MDSNAKGVPEATPRPLWKISNYRPYRIIERDPGESTYKVGDDKFPTIVDVHGTNEEQRERALRIVTAVNSYDALQAENKVLREACELALKRVEFALRSKQNVVT